MRLCSYVVVHDKGFAPNPFGGLCTLAACTPNHQGLRLSGGDWILGNSSAAAGSQLIYAMRIREVLDFDDYLRDANLHEEAQPDMAERCGDLSIRDRDGRWHRTGLLSHRPHDIAKDTPTPRLHPDHFFTRRRRPTSQPDTRR